MKSFIESPRGDSAYLPHAMSSGETRPERSGSSPYQKIQSSLAAVRERGGGAGEGAMFISNMPDPVAEAAAGPEVDGVAATRRHTHKMSPARHREKLESTGSILERGAPETASHFAPHEFPPFDTAEIRL